MKKSKFLKPFSFASLALLMGAAGVFAFAPLGISSAQEQPTTTTGLGLDPKNDPVVYTTESGLEIRMSNATKYSGTTTVTTNRGYSYTQDLTSFYYFTMGSFSGTIHTGASTSATFQVTNQPVNWVILGLGPNTAYFLDEVSENLFSTWKTNNYGYANSNGASGGYFFSNFYETDSPAGQLIDSTVSAKTYIMDKVAASIPQDPADEIPEGCMLVISEKLLGNMYFNSSGTSYSIYTSSVTYFLRANVWHSNRYRYTSSKVSSSSTNSATWTTNGNAGGSLYNYINSLFSKNNSTGAIEGNNNLGFTKAQADLIVPQQLYTYYSKNADLQETPETDGGTYYTMFPLATTRNMPSSIQQNFCIENYLDTNAKRVACYIGNNQSQPWWLRNGHRSDYQQGAQHLHTDGSVNQSSVDCLFGVRPAMVMKLQ